MIELCFDFVSPYSYVAWHRVKAVAAAHGRAIEPVPVVFGAILSAHGTLGPAEVPAKRAYVLKDTLRAAHAAGVPFGPPPAHPFSSLLALRVAIQPTDPAARAALIDRLFAAVWAGGGPGVEDAAVVARICDEVGLDGAALVAGAKTDDVKARLRASTDRAIERGAFGVPTMFVDGELFWGNDSLAHVDRFLAAGDPVTADELARWAGVRPSVTRAR
jgi:2-hydroxychromene-2-carboxylate isomerase